MTNTPEQPAGGGPDYHALAHNALPVAEAQPHEAPVLLHAAVMLLNAGNIAEWRRFAIADVTASPANASALRAPALASEIRDTRCYRFIVGP